MLIPNSIDSTVFPIFISLCFVMKPSSFATKLCAYVSVFCADTHAKVQIKKSRSFILNIEGKIVESMKKNICFKRF
jgi:hypothetical protein